VCKFFLIILGNEALFDPTHMAFILACCNSFNELTDFDREEAATWFIEADKELMLTAVKVL
jgi:hypothetical protein